MTEDEWHLCQDPQAMLDALSDEGDEQKLRLFACACCREPAVWHYLSRVSRQAVAIAENFAHGRATRHDFQQSMTATPVPRRSGGPWNARCKVHLSSQAQADNAVRALGDESALGAASAVGRYLVNLVSWPRQCEILRELWKRMP